MFVLGWDWETRSRKGGIDSVWEEKKGGRVKWLTRDLDRQNYKRRNRLCMFFYYTF